VRRGRHLEKSPRIQLHPWHSSWTGYFTSSIPLSRKIFGAPYLCLVGSTSLYFIVDGQTYGTMKRALLSLADEWVYVIPQHSAIAVRRVDRRPPPTTQFPAPDGLVHSRVSN